MIPITIPACELYDESTCEFIEMKEPTILKLEHSLVSLSKWESKWHKPFLEAAEKTNDETIDYIRCMTLNNVDPKIYKCLTPKNIKDINEYIADPMTATTFSEDKVKSHSREIITSELIYYWMIAQSIPVEFEKWHLNRLLTLIRVCNIKNQPPKKMGKNEILRQNAALNASRRKKLNSKG